MPDAYMPFPKKGPQVVQGWYGVDPNETRTKWGAFIDNIKVGSDDGKT